MRPSEPVRRCAVCRRAMPKAQMLRLAMDDTGELWPDLWGKAGGRGLYHCMSEECLRRSPRRWRTLRVKDRRVHPDWPRLAARIGKGLEAAIEMQLQRARPQAALGRDAVLRRLWQHSPVVVLLAEDAGSALKRQIARACDRKQAAGEWASLVEAPGGGWLAKRFARATLSVAALDARMASRLAYWLAWRRRLRRYEERSA